MGLYARRVGYGLLILSVLFFLYGLKFFGKRLFFGFTIGSILLWVLAASLIIQHKENRKWLFSFILTLFVLLASPLMFIYFETARGIASYHGGPIRTLIVYEVVVVFCFFGSLVFLISQRGKIAQLQKHFWHKAYK